jgi:hypothetical protein
VQVTALTGTGTLQGKKNWRATVTATVRNTDGVAMSGATVSGTFSTGGSLSCITAGNGVCTMLSGAIRASSASTTFTVGNVTGTGLQWDVVNSIKTVTVSMP